MDAPAERYLQYLEEIFQKQAEFYRAEDPQDDYPIPSVMVFNGIPKPGYMTCVTYGLSYATHPKWKNQRRAELIMTVNTQDPQWALALVDLVAGARGRHPFSWGNMIDLGHAMVEGSNKTGFLFFSPAILGQDVYLDIEIGLPYKICLTGAYPITDANMEQVGKIGMQDFWESNDFAFIDVVPGVSVQ